MSYSGWKNKETWLVNVWFNPETNNDVDMIESQLQDDLDELETGFTHDILATAIAEIDWDEIREALDDEDESDEDDED